MIGRVFGFFFFFLFFENEPRLGIKSSKEVLMLLCAVECLRPMLISDHTSSEPDGERHLIEEKIEPLNVAPHAGKL